MGVLIADNNTGVTDGERRMVDAEALLESLEPTVGWNDLARAVGVVDDLTADQGDPDAAAWAELLDRFPTIRRFLPPLVDQMPLVPGGGRRWRRPGAQV